MHQEESQEGDEVPNQHPLATVQNTAVGRAEETIAPQEPESPQSTPVALTATPATATSGCQTQQTTKVMAMHWGRSLGETENAWKKRKSNVLDQGRGG